MKFYLDTIEQIIGVSGEFSEYGGREKKNDEQAALTAFYQKLSNVAADLGKGHTYMDIKIVNSEGGCIKRDSVGQYQQEEPVEE